MDLPQFTNKTLLITLEYPPQKGGIARYLYNIYTRLPAGSAIILAPKSPDAATFDATHNAPIYRRSLSVWWAWPRWRIISWHVITLYFREHFKEIHLSHVLPVGYIAYIFKFFFGIPYVIYTHGMDVLLPQESRWKKYWLRKILQNAREIYANSNFTKEEIIKLGIAGDIKVLYPCIQGRSNKNPEGLPDIRAARGLKRKKIILSVGRLTERKGFDQVITALPEILKSREDAHYVIVGQGADLTRLQELAKEKKVANAVTFIQDAADEEVDMWYAVCDVFAMPARQIGGDAEGFGIVFLEAALRAKATLGGRSGGIGEAMQDGVTGVLVNPHDSKEIALKLIELLENELLRNNLGARGRERVLKNFLCD